jgi:hypothetical protein
MQQQNSNSLTNICEMVDMIDMIDMLQDLASRFHVDPDE